MSASRLRYVAAHEHGYSHPTPNSELSRFGLGRGYDLLVERKQQVLRDLITKRLKQPIAAPDVIAEHLVFSLPLLKVQSLRMWLSFYHGLHSSHTIIENGAEPEGPCCTWGTTRKSPSDISSSARPAPSLPRAQVLLHARSRTPARCIPPRNANVCRRRRKP
jgi:hypothetical protein